MNISPSIPGPRPRDTEDQGLDILRALAPLNRAMGLGRLARSTLLGFAIGAALGACILLAAHIRSFDFALPSAILATVIGIVAGAALGISRWPPALEAARAADLHFCLDDRLTTALELHRSDTAVAALQRRDVARHIDGLSLGQSRGRWMRWSEAAAAALAAVAFVVALALGAQTHDHRVAAAAPTDTARVRRASAAQVQKLTSQLHIGLTPGQSHSEAMRRLDLALARLRRQLLHVSTRRAALRAVSATQQQLRQLARGLHPVNAKAVAQLNGSLSRYLSKAQTRSGKGSSSRSTSATAQALNRLAQSLAHLTAAQRAALAHALAKAANATSNTALRSLLRQAASSLARGNTQSASAALRQASQALTQSLAASAAQSRLGTAGSQLNSLKAQLSGVTGTIPSNQLGTTYNGRSGQTPGQGNSRAAGTKAGTGRGIGTGRGLRPGQGRGSGFARGTGTRPGAGTGRGNGRGQGRGRGATGRPGTAAGAAQGASGARGTGGRGRANPTRAGRNVTVYIPAKQGKGRETIQNGPNGAPDPGAIVPYQQVVGQYAQSAHQALDRTAVPPSLRGYVRRYFSSISH